MARRERTDRWAELFAFAAAQHHVVHLGQAERFGIPRTTLRERARAEGWSRPHDAVVLLPGAAETFPARCVAATLAAGSHALVGRWSALHLRDLIRTTPSHVDLVVPASHSAPRLDRVRSWRSRTLEDGDRDEVLGVPTTTTERTLVDLAGVAEVDYLRSRTLAAIQRRLTTPDRIASRLRAIGPYPGRARMSDVLAALRSEAPDSGFEHDVRTFLRRRGLGAHLHPRPFPFRCPDGVVIHLDVAMPRWWLAVECDSILWHGGSRAFETDRLRWSQAQAGGWRIVWVTDERFRRDREGIIAEISAHIAAADPGRPPPVPADPTASTH